MASMQPKSRRPAKGGKMWRARVKWEYEEYFLGSYDTKEEAEKVEHDFRIANGVQLKKKITPKVSQL